MLRQVQLCLCCCVEWRTSLSLLSWLGRPVEDEAARYIRERKREQIGMIMRASMAAGMGEQRDLRIPEHLQLPVDGRQGDSHMEPEPEGVDDGQPRSEHGETDLQVTLSQTGTCWQMHMILRAVRSTSCGYHRHYRPTASEREGSDFQQDGGRDYMDVDNPQPPEGHDDEAKSPNNRSVLKPPPTDMDWWDFENLFKYIKRHKKKNWDAHHKPAEGIHSNKVGILLQQNLPSHGTFDHIVTWNADECHDYGLFWKIVIMEDSDDNFDEYARLYIEHRRRNRA